jgi:catechol 2,3-dioxygenase-like lactoylglutathione lyase family enzyme
MEKQTDIRYHSAVTFVRDIAISKEFYTKLLEQEVELDFGKNVILKGGLTLWEIQPDHIIPELLGLDTIGNKRGNRFELYFETKDIDKIYRKLEKHGVEFLHSLHEEPWGQRTVRFFDPDRHLLEIGETLETFVKRLFDGNMTVEQISQKTKIPAGIVKQLLGE